MSYRLKETKSQQVSDNQCFGGMLCCFDLYFGPPSCAQGILYLRDHIWQVLGDKQGIKDQSQFAYAHGKCPTCLYPLKDVNHKVFSFLGKKCSVM